jgi:hypothetical protein
VKFKGQELTTLSNRGMRAIDEPDSGTNRHRPGYRRIAAGSASKHLAAATGR